MREYKLTVDCRCKSCDLRMIPLTVKSNPFPDLFKAATPEPLAPLLQATLASHIADLSVDNVNTISYRVDDSLLAAESRGRLRLVLRHPEDEGVSAPEAPQAVVAKAGSSRPTAREIERVR